MKQLVDVSDATLRYYVGHLADHGIDEAGLRRGGEFLRRVLAG